MSTNALIMRLGGNEVVDLTADDDEDSSGQEVGVDHPLELGGRKPQAGLHVGETSHDRSGVVADRQHREAAGDQHRPELALCLRRGGRHH